MKINQAEANAAFNALKAKVDEFAPSVMRSHITDQMIFDMGLIALEAAFPHRRKPAPAAPVAIGKAETK